MEVFLNSGFLLSDEFSFSQVDKEKVKKKKNLTENARANKEDSKRKMCFKRVNSVDGNRKDHMNETTQTQKDKGNGTPTQPQNLQPTICQLSRHTGAMVTQNLWKFLTNDSSNLRSTP